MAFSSKGLNFLQENCMRNSREWYNENKETYITYVKQPFIDFILKLQPTLNEIDNKIIVDTRRISRIHRDARISKGKSIFRNRVWCVFSQGKELYNGLPGFFFEFSAKGYTYGCGYYYASANSMNAIRSLIINNDKSYVNALKTYKNQNIFELVGDSYKRNHYPNQSLENCNWLNRKSICLMHSDSNASNLFEDNLADKVAEDFKKIASVYHFFMKAEEIARS